MTSAPLAPPPQPAPARPRLLRAALALTSLFALLGAAAVAWLQGRPEPLPDLGRLPAFSLEGHDGSKVTLETLAGRPWVADFIFTTCAGSCPAMTARMARVRRELHGAARFVSFTVDPRHDTPEVLARYAAPLDPGADWLFVTGAQAELYRLATEGFHLEAFEVPPEQQDTGGDGPFLHSTKFVVVDGQGRIRGYYDSADEADMTRLAGDVQRLS